MPKILIADGMAADAVKRLRDAGFQVDEQHYAEPDLIQAIPNYDCVVVRSATKITEPVIDAGKNLKLIIRGGVGIDNIKAAYAKEKGIKVMNTPRASSASVAELALAFIFSLARRLPEANATMKAGKWEKKAFAEGFEVQGKTLGIIGIGRIGTELAMMAGSLGLRSILAYDKFVDYTPFRWVTMCSKDELLAKSDFISLHIPVPGAEPEIGRKEFAKMKDGVVIVNCARGGVVDEEALIEALNSGKVRAAGIDVYVGEPNPRRDLIDHPRVYCTPHIGAATIEAQDRVGMEVVSILLREFPKA
ncbi:MAG: 3-phosphoglycerate dehydrogenase [Calditrichaeota bacterium]|nr:3-phosphoglycerate dehydrogenase [Calditrichota bacterium]